MKTKQITKAPLVLGPGLRCIGDAHEMPRGRFAIREGALDDVRCGALWLRKKHPAFDSAPSYPVGVTLPPLQTRVAFTTLNRDSKLSSVPLDSPGKSETLSLSKTSAGFP